MNDSKVPQRRVVYGHFELGDALVISGIVRHMAKDGKPLELFTGMGVVHEVRRLYTDVPNVQTWGVPPDYSRVYGGIREHIPGVLFLGYFADPALRFDKSKWDSEFYRLAGVPFELKWSEFKLPPELLGPKPEPQRLILIHDMPDRGVHIDMRRIPRKEGYSVVPITRRGSVWDWIPQLRAAEEIHVCDSVFLNLADLMHGKGWLRATRLVYHKYARGQAPPVLKGPWEVIL